MERGNYPKDIKILVWCKEDVAAEWLIWNLLLYDSPKSKNIKQNTIQVPVLDCPGW